MANKDSTYINNRVYLNCKVCNSTMIIAKVINGIVAEYNTQLIHPFICDHALCVNEDGTRGLSIDCEVISGKT